MSAVGLPARQCPFLTGAKGECPHNFYLTGQKPDEAFLSDFSIMMHSIAPQTVKHFIPDGKPPSKVMVVTTHISQWMNVHNLHQLGCPTQAMSTTMSDPNLMRKVMAAGLSNLGHLLIASVAGDNTHKLRDVIRQALISRTKLTLLTDEDPTLVGFAGHYQTAVIGPHFKTFLEKWAHNPSQFSIMGDYYLFNKMREMPVMHDG